LIIAIKNIYNEKLSEIKVFFIEV